MAVAEASALGANRNQHDPATFKLVRAVVGKVGTCPAVIGIRIEIGAKAKRNSVAADGVSLMSAIGVVRGF